MFDETYSDANSAARTSRPNGFTIFFSGLSGAGKSTVAVALQKYLLKQRRSVMLLDGDMFRTPLSEHADCFEAFRTQNTLRLGSVAEKITRAGGIAICAAIAPQAEIRERVRKRIEQHGRFILVYVATPLSVCEERNSNGLYQKAQQGLIDLTGVTSPYETPLHPDLEIDLSRTSVAEAVEVISRHLRGEGLVE